MVLRQHQRVALPRQDRLLIDPGTKSRQCGRVVYSDWHAEYNAFSPGKTFPDECPTADITTAQSILEYMLFDLSSCVQPYTPVCTPQTCAALGVECGPAGDGCGGRLDCGQCPTGTMCGYARPGQCGHATIY